MNLLEKYLGEKKKGYIVFGTIKKEYLAKFDYDMDFEHISGEYQQKARSRTPLGWSKDKNNAVVFPDKGSAEVALEYTLTKKYGVVKAA